MGFQPLRLAHSQSVVEHGLLAKLSEKDRKPDNFQHVSDFVNSPKCLKTMNQNTRSFGGEQHSRKNTTNYVIKEITIKLTQNWHCNRDTALPLLSSATFGL